MKITIEADAKEIAALVLKLQGRQILENTGEMDLDDLGIKLCADNVFENK